MKITIAQVEKAINNTFQFGVDGTEQQYDAVREVSDKAIMDVGTMVQKTVHYFNKSDWNKVYKKIQQALA